MSSFKPKLYRSLEGCCICKAKSSSSRFTDSKKYEEDCVGCFKLDDTRNGEICNACVLIVKRWKKLPANTTKDWHHVVDARTGPGIKNVFRNKKRDHVTTPDRHVYKHKHVYRRKRKRLIPVRTEKHVAKDQSNLLDFIDTDYWRRESFCCGVVYIGQLGEVMLDKRYSHECQVTRCQVTSLTSSPRDQVSSDLSTDKEHDNQEVEENEEFYPEPETDKIMKSNNNDNENEDNFYDKLENKIDNFTTAAPSLITSH